MRFSCSIINRADIKTRNEVIRADVIFTADDLEHAEEVADFLAGLLQGPVTDVVVDTPNKMEVDNLYELA